MNQNKKHTTLTAEELVKLLDLKSDNDANLTGLDDFEKEALDGFKANTTSSEAKKLVDSIQIEISKKTSQTNTINSNKDSTSKKNKIVWFSVAASLLLILTLSIFLIHKANIISEKSLAINEPIKNQEPSKSITKASDTLNSGNDIRKISEELKNDTEDIRIKKNKIKADTQTLTFGNGASSPSNKTVLNRAIINNSVISTNNQNDNPTKNEISNTDAVTTNKNNTENKTQPYLSKPVLNSEKFANDMEEISDSIIIKEKVAKNTEGINNKDYLQKDPTKIETSLSKSSEVGILDDDKLNTDLRALQGASPSKVSQNFQAYYTGGELAIKEYILDYYKKTKSTQKLQGKFIIKATVLTNGALVVISVNQLSKDYSNCMDFLKEALNTMKEWNSATKNGTQIDSETQFTLIF